MQRVAIARALVNNPEILLADEPTGALDSETSKQIMDILAEVAKDRLVIMVTHNPELAKEYSTRIIKLKDGKIIDDSNPYEEVSESVKHNQKTKKTSMGLFTALSLSLNNLMTKKGRTFLTAFAGSIGIIGIALILSLSHGVRAYIDKTERETLSNYPLTIEKNTFDMGISLGMDSIDNLNQDCEEGNICSMDDVTINPAVMALSNEVKNNLKDFKKAINDNYHNINDYIDGFGYSYDIDLHLYTKSSDGYKAVGEALGRNVGVSAFKELINNDELLKDQYKVLAGHMPTNYNELVLVVDKDGNLPISVLYDLNIIDDKNLEDDIKKVKDGTEKKLNTPNYKYDDFIGLKYKLVYNYLLFENINGKWTNISYDKSKVDKIASNGLDLEIVGVVKVADDTTAADKYFVGYNYKLIEHVIEQNNNSEIVKKQLANKEINIFTGYAFDKDYSYESVAYMLGMAELDNPSTINIYPKNYDAKDKIKNIINEYNDEQSDENKIQYTDYVGILMSGITNIINVITYILVAFVAISLVVSSIMISIITYISVLERTKEIGILRAIGASKKDVTRVFNAETIIEGFVAGVFGILVTLLLCIPINKVVYSLFSVNNIASLPTVGALVLIGISVLLTVIAGLIPSRMAAKKDPVESLRTE